MVETNFSQTDVKTCQHIVDSTSDMTIEHVNLICTLQETNIPEAKLKIEKIMAPMGAQNKYLIFVTINSECYHWGERCHHAEKLELQRSLLTDADCLEYQVETQFSSFQVNLMSSGAMNMYI